ncbi:Rpn family recombination-promoting nuclease/putative transposase [Spirulina sp. CS-785/01]|uniref:Rpn family recombination-promoting nuclease/putative transposase n=1 Tax=Spirulina sp. CS-785/01 TaxID=3021716 RepID=UPI0023307090|nr:Rpn family recombination-promoting nuclease/putative transposase [Spirulina sp. CS-785/01]MDB9312948.1 Rpn family recombination-promoting nuclease/putative transposase [Spirulina sp. CS-785/01]
MNTDSLFYRLFQNFPPLLFELIGVSVPQSEGYQFNSVELKQTAFRLDGVFAPPKQAETSPIFFVEVQFSGEREFYSRLFTEIFLYLRQYKPRHPWQAVVIYPSRQVDIGETQHYQELLEQRTSRIYLDELAKNPDSIGLSLVQLVMDSQEEAIQRGKALVSQTKQEIEEGLTRRQILDLVETIIVYKIPNLSPEEIQEMLGFTEIDIKQTRFYQEVYAEGAQEGRQEGEVQLVLRLLSRRFGQLGARQEQQIRQLSLEQLEALAEALLDFSSLAELEEWLERQ